MSASKVSDLLPIPDGVKTPHAYQVFGLDAGTADADAVQSAIKSTISRLKQHKSGADPKVWKTAAKLVQQAESILADPQKRRELDAKFGIVDIPDAPSDVPEDVPFDPLAGVLPSTDPLADVAPSTVAPTTPAAVEANTVPPHAAPAQPAAELFTVRSTTPRRRRKSSSSWFLGLLTLGLFAIIGILGYFVFYGPGEVAITTTDGSLMISTGGPDRSGKPGTNEPATKTDTSPGEPQPEPNFDPVMPKTVGGETETPSEDEPSLMRDGEPIEGLPPELQKLLDDKPMRPDGDSTAPMNPQAPMEPQAPNNDAASEPPMMTETTTDPVTVLDVKPSTETGEMEMTEEMVKAIDTRIEKLRGLIRDAKWKEMTPAASDLKEALMTDDQRKDVEALYEIADLAAYYYGAVERGVMTRQPAETIDVSEDLTVAVVEVGPDLLVIRYAGKNKSYSLSNLPFILAHRMAAFTLSQDKSSNVMAKACYQAIAPNATKGDRDEAIQWITSSGADVPGADPKRIAETLKLLFR